MGKCFRSHVEITDKNVVMERQLLRMACPIVTLKSLHKNVNKMERQLWKVVSHRHVEITDKNVIKWKESFRERRSHRHIEITDKNAVKWKESSGNGVSHRHS